MNTPKDKYSLEKQVLTDFCQEQGLHYSEKREAVLMAFLEMKHHISAEELYNHTKDKVEVDPKTIRNSLEIFVAAGLARTVQLEDGSVYYDHIFAHQHHDHLVCRRCAKIIEFSSPPLEKMQDEIASSHNFTLEDHNLTLYGICQECAAKTKLPEIPKPTKAEAQNLIPLAKLKAGQSGTIKELLCGENALRRLASMGLRPGKHITKVSAMLLGGPVVVSIDRRQLAIGNGMAKKVLVEINS
ncbi:MAG: transcriptional repressor [Pseudomonadota bacterium]